MVLKNTLRLIYLTIYVSDLARSRSYYEHGLGFRVLDAQQESVRYAAGHVILDLHRADCEGIRSPARKDRSVALTFLVEDLTRMRTALADRGVRVTPTLTSKAGMMADLYDPDGHWISLYQPSDAALDWPSGAKIQAMRVATDGRELDPTRLDAHELIYVFLFVQDLHATSTFYGTRLGLDAVEITPCHRGVSNVPDGVVKYDVGGALLTTHHVGDGEHAASHKVTTEASGGVALGFHVSDLHTAVADLSQRGVRWDGLPIPTHNGDTAAFRDPGGHVYYLCEPSAASLAQPRGAALERILAAQL